MFPRTASRWSVETAISATYAAISGLWIALSDRAAEALVSDTAQLTRLQQWKGWFFVAASTALIYVLLRRHRLRHDAAARRLVESDAQLRDVVEHAADGILVVGRDERLISANPAACRLLGLNEAELMAGGRDLIIAPDDPVLLAALAERAGTGRFEGVLPFRRKDGVVIDAETSSRSFVAADGTERMIMIFRDITERRAAERRLRESETRYRTLFDGHHVPALLIDPATGRIVDANLAAARFYGWTVDRLRTMDIGDLNTLSTEELEREMSAARAEERNWFRFVHRTATGEQRPVDVYSGPLTLDGRALLFSVVHDQTSLHRTQATLARMNRMFGMLSETNQALLRVSDRASLLQRVCELAVAQGMFRFAWVGLTQSDSSVTLVARAGDDAGYLEGLRVSASAGSPEGQGATGVAIREDRPVVLNDFATASRYQPWALAGRRAGVQASAAIPIRAGGRVIGALNLYASETDFFDAEVVATLTDMANDVTFGLDRLADLAERERLTRELERAGMRWKFALEGAGHGVWEWDFLTDEIVVSASLAAMVGLTVHDAPRHLAEWLPLVHPDDLPMLGSVFEAFAKGEVPTYRAEYRVRSSSGQYLWVLSSGSVLERDADGKPLRAIGTQVDLSEVKRSQAARAELETLSRTLVEHSIDCILLLRKERIVYVNPAGVRLLSAASAGSVVGCTVYDIFHPHSHAHVDVRLAQLASAPGVTSAPVRDRIVTRAARVVDVEASAVSYLQDGELVSQMTIRDLSGRLRAERELAETSTRLQLALSSAGQGVYDLDFENGTVVVSPEYATMLGFDPATFRETTAAWLDRTHPEDRARCETTLKDYLAGRIPEYRIQFRQRTQDGQWKWILSLGRIAARRADGTPTRMLGTHTEVKEPAR